jgi:hypothetical protein
MSRAVPFDGLQLQLNPAALWTYITKVVPLGTSFTLAALYPPPGPLLAEWFMVNADVNNDDFVIFGERTLNFPGGITGFNAITSLGPGEWLVFEPNDKGLKTTDGILTAPDGEAVQFQMIEDYDLIDVTQFYAMPGQFTAGFGSNQGCALQCTIGARSRR